VFSARDAYVRDVAELVTATFAARTAKARHAATPLAGRSGGGGGGGGGGGVGVSSDSSSDDDASEEAKGVDEPSRVAAAGSGGRLTVVDALVVAGQAGLKHKLVASPHLAKPLARRVAKVLDVQYGGARGVRDAVALAQDVLRATDLARETRALAALFGHLSRDTGLAAVGAQEVAAAIDAGVASTVLLAARAPFVHLRLRHRDAGLERSLVLHASSAALAWPRARAEGAPAVSFEQWADDVEGEALEAATSFAAAAAAAGDGTPTPTGAGAGVGTGTGAGTLNGGAGLSLAPAARLWGGGDSGCWQVLHALPLRQWLAAASPAAGASVVHVRGGSASASQLQAGLGGVAAVLRYPVALAEAAEELAGGAAAENDAAADSEDDDDEDEEDWSDDEGGAFDDSDADSLFG